MTPFFALLSAYYLCDAAAALRPLTMSEIARCVGHYEAVKAEFADPAETGPDARLQTYRRFKAWEAQNAETVARLKAEAEALVAAQRRGEPV